MSTLPEPFQQPMSGIDEPSVFRTLFVAYPDALIVADASGGIVLANPAAANLLGYTIDELVGLNVDVLVPDSIRPRHASYRDAYGRNPRPRPMGTQMELVAKRRDGSEVMVEIALSPLQDHGLPLVVAAIRDIGAYPRVKQALQRARYSEHLAQLGRLAVDARDPQVLLDQVPVIAAQALQVEVAMVLLLEPNRLEFRVASGVGLLLDGEVLGARVPNRPTRRPASCSQQGKPVIVADYRDRAALRRAARLPRSRPDERARGAAVRPRPRSSARSRCARAAPSASATTRCASSNRCRTCSRPACSARSRRRRSTTRSASKASAS